MSVDNLQKSINANDLHASNGALFLASLRGSLNSDYRALVIGVGGSGVKTLNSLKIELDRRFIDWGSSVQLLAVDTSIEELSASGLNQTNDIFKLECYGSAQNFDIDVNRIETVNEWINPAFKLGRSVESTEGSRQVRQVSIAKLYHNNTSGYNTSMLQNKIFKKITTLNTNRNDRPMIVLIALGLAGGTGSGLVNDIAVLTQEKVFRFGKCRI